MKQKYPVVILPGWLLGSDRFKPTAHEFEKAGFKTYIVDFPGFEQGEKLFRAWTLSDYVNFLANFLSEKKISKAIFVAHSFGGRVVLKLLKEHPQKAYAIVLSGTPGFRSVGTTRLYLLALFAKVGKELLALPLISFFQDIGRKLFYAIIRASDIRHVSGFMKQTFINIVEEDLVKYMQGLDVPTLLLWGSKDGLVSVGVAEKMQQTIKNSKLVIIPNARHNFIYKDPIAFTNEVTLFLDSLLK